MTDILAKLSGGDLRSIGESEAVVKEVVKNPALLAKVFAGLRGRDPVVRMRAADVVEKATRTRPELLRRWKRDLLGSIAEREDKEVRWHIAQMLPRLKLTSTERSRAVSILLGYLKDDSSLVRTFSMQALADLATQDERLLREVKPLLQRAARAGTPAMKSRGRRLLKALSGKLASE